MTMAEMERDFDQQWVLIINPWTDPETGDIGRGEVAGHGPDRDELARLLDVIDPKRYALPFLGQVQRDGIYLL